MENLFFFPARVGILIFDVIPLDSTFPYLYLDLARKQLCFPPGKGINRRNESTTERTFITLVETLQNFTEPLSEIVYNYC